MLTLLSIAEFLLRGEIPESIAEQGRWMLVACFWYPTPWCKGGQEDIFGANLQSFCCLRLQAYMFKNMSIVEPRFNEPLYNDVLGIAEDILQPGQSYSTMYGTEPWYNEPRYNEILVITNTIEKPKLKSTPIWITHSSHDKGWMWNGPTAMKIL